MKRNKVLYFHRRKDTGKVFYVGVGNLERAKAKDNRNQYWHNIVNKVGYDIEIVHTDLTWEEASVLERQYIKEFGRRDLGLGNLVNMTDGGEGQKNPSKETREKQRKGKLNKPFSEKGKIILRKLRTGTKQKQKTIDKIKKTMSKTFAKRKETTFFRDKNGCSIPGLTLFPAAASI